MGTWSQTTCCGHGQLSTRPTRRSCRAGRELIASHEYRRTAAVDDPGLTWPPIGQRACVELRCLRMLSLRMNAFTGLLYGTIFFSIDSNEEDTVEQVSATIQISLDGLVRSVATDAVVCETGEEAVRGMTTYDATSRTVIFTPLLKLQPLTKPACCRLTISELPQLRVVLALFS